MYAPPKVLCRKARACDEAAIRRKEMTERVREGE